LVRRPVLGALALAVLTAAAALPLASNDRVVASSAVGVPNEASPSQNLSLARKGSQLQRDAMRVRDTGVTGVLAEVTTEERSLLARAGVARLGTRTEVPYRARFRAGSTTKAFVAIVVMQLVAEGRLSLEDTVERWLPGLVRGKGGDGREITLRQLLQHTSGIPDYYPHLPLNRSLKAFRRHRFDPPTPEQAVRIALKHRRQFEPGAGWAYSNTNYILAGMIVNRVTGNSWYHEVRSRILRPLALRHTTLGGADPSLPPPHARAYELFRPGGPLIDVTRLVDNSADGGLIATTGDINRVLAALLRGELVPQPELREMRMTVPAKGLRQFWPGARDGLGLFRLPLSCGGFYWGHSGDSWGFMTRNGVTADGRRSATVSMSTELAADERALLRQDEAARRLIDRALCSG
jgi:D-alanyl-D-alanine carboxypeptidase